MPASRQASFASRTRGVARCEPDQFLRIPLPLPSGQPLGQVTGHSRQTAYNLNRPPATAWKILGSCGFLPPVATQVRRELQTKFALAEDFSRGPQSRDACYDSSSACLQIK